MSGHTHHHHGRDPECLRVFEALSEYLDGELSPVDCRHLEEHMAGCEPCIDFLESLKQSIAVSRRLPLGPPPPSMPEEVRGKLMSAWQEALRRRGGSCEPH